jgi:hypothetical protein
MEVIVQKRRRESRKREKRTVRVLERAESSESSTKPKALGVYTNFLLDVSLRECSSGKFSLVQGKQHCSSTRYYYNYYGVFTFD